MTEPRNLPQTRQPDAEPDQAPRSNPSLITYSAMVLIATAMIALALSLGADWPGLLVNLGSSLISAVVLLIFIDQRFKQSEIRALRGMPAMVKLFLSLTISPRRKQLFRFNQRQLGALGNLTENKVTLRAFAEVSKKEGSFNLLGRSGSGKTTVLQMLCSERGRQHAADFSRPVPILYALSHWLPDGRLDEAILEHVNGFYPVSRRAFKATLMKHRAILILDGADDATDPDRLGCELARLREIYSTVTWIVSSGPVYPIPMTDMPSISLAPPTSDEIDEIFRRL